MTKPVMHPWSTLPHPSHSAAVVARTPSLSCPSRYSSTTDDDVEPCANRPMRQFLSSARPGVHFPARRAFATGRVGYSPLSCAHDIVSSAHDEPLEPRRSLSLSSQEVFSHERAFFEHTQESSRGERAKSGKQRLTPPLCIFELRARSARRGRLSSRQT